MKHKPKKTISERMEIDSVDWENLPRKRKEREKG
jgi:hypothetical protein